MRRSPATGPKKLPSIARAINYLVNEAPGTHGRAAGMGLRAVDGVPAWSCEPAYARAVVGAEPADVSSAQKTLDVPAIKGIGGVCSISSIAMAPGLGLDTEFEWLDVRDPAPGAGAVLYRSPPTTSIAAAWTSGPASTNAVQLQIRFFDIEGRASGLFSRALTSPDGKIRIPINEDAGDSGQIEEYLTIYRGEGIQHIACGARDVYRTVETLRADGLPFMPSPPDTYFEKIDARLPQHGEDVARLQRDGILIDGEGVVDGGQTKVLLQIFRRTRSGDLSSSSSARAMTVLVRAQALFDRSRKFAGAC
jgi:4-hydroxyphenylpyruvate dioxygenase